MYTGYLKFWKVLTKRRRYQLVALSLLILISSALEVVSISAVIPFLYQLVDFGITSESHAPKYLNAMFGFLGKTELGILFIGLVFLSSGLRFGLLAYQSKLSQQIGADISCLIFSKFINADYLSQKNTKTSELVSTISSRINLLVYNVVLPFVIIISSSFLSILIIALLFMINPIVTIAVLGLMSALYILVATFNKNKILKYGEEVNHLNAQIVERIQDAKKALREIKIDSAEKLIQNEHQTIELKSREAQASLMIIGAAPRFIIEVFGVAIIIAITIISSNINKVDVIPLMGVVVLALQKLLPLTQQIYSSWSNIVSGRSGLKSIIETLEKGEEKSSIYGCSEISIVDCLRLENITYSYSRKMDVIRNANLEVKRGEIVGLFGESGAGKSTIIDIMLGLIWPSSGVVKVGNTELRPENLRSWWNKVAHVPQSSFILNKSVAENLFLGKKDIPRKVFDAAYNIAGLNEVFGPSDGADLYMLGENGRYLSGGQQQRVCLARALCRAPDFLILDEATSALDASSELKVFKELIKFMEGRTIILITHRLELLKFCNKIYEIKDGTLSKVNC